MGQRRIVSVLHSNTSTGTFLKTGSSPIIRTILDLHILQTYRFWKIFFWGTWNTMSMLTIPELLMRSRITFERRYGENFTWGVRQSHYKL